MDTTRHMIIFDVLTWESPVGDKGDTLRLFLSDEGYIKAKASEKRGKIKIRKHATIIEGHTPCWSITIFTAARKDRYFYFHKGERIENTMKRPLAYITAPWGENEFENTENAAKYCRAVYDAGFSPICPTLFLPLFFQDEIPQEHKDGIDMAREYLRRAHVLVVCGETVDESVKNDIAVAERLRITATTLDGILTVECQGRTEGGCCHG